MTTNNVTAPEAIDGFIDALGLITDQCNREARTEVCAARAALERALILSLDWVDMIDDDRRCDALDTAIEEVPECVEVPDSVVDAARVEENEHDGDWARVTLGTTVYLLQWDEDAEVRDGDWHNLSEWRIRGSYPQ